MSHNWIFLIYCYFSFNCPVLGFFLPAAEVCGVAAVFLGTGGGPFTLNILSFFFFFFKAKPNLFLYNSGCACRVRGRNGAVGPPQKITGFSPEAGAEQRGTAQPRAEPTAPPPLLGFGVNGAACRESGPGDVLEGELFWPSYASNVKGERAKRNAKPGSLYE